jgi:hypothetical protein
MTQAEILEAVARILFRRDAVDAEVGSPLRPVHNHVRAELTLYSRLPFGSCSSPTHAP